RPYPWGLAKPSCEWANHAMVGLHGPRPCVGGPMKADSLPDAAGPYGHVHLVGNVWEPVSDIWHPRTYGDGTARTDPGGPSGEGYRVLRGGGYDTFSTNMRLANRMSALVEGSKIGVRCARPTVTPTSDTVTALETVRHSGTVRGVDRLEGTALYVTAFLASDTENGALRRGASPLAEARMAPNGGVEQSFSLEVPAVDRFYLYASLDGGAPEPGKPPSGSGGVGRLADPVDGARPQAGLVIQLEALPGVVPMPKGKAKARPSGTPGGPGPGVRSVPGTPRGPQTRPGTNTRPGGKR
ncbi:MAG TPA: hypothetical protein DFR83_18260, partial [Deltaproteobacteria bacterium]|nr:hypothetical protein [Deltaproteobacteria bacterium]